MEIADKTEELHLKKKTKTKEQAFQLWKLP